MIECEHCGNYSYDDEEEDWFCEAAMDEDDTAQLLLNKSAHCPYWRSSDEYRTVRHQAVGHLPGERGEGRFFEENAE